MVDIPLSLSLDYHSHVYSMHDRTHDLKPRGRLPLEFKTI